MEEGLAVSREGPRPTLIADFGRGEQFWRLWHSVEEVGYVDGRRVRFKVLSKKGEHDGEPCFTFVAIRRFSDGIKEIFGQGFFNQDPLLVSCVKGIELALKSVLPSLDFVHTDFRDCDTLAKFQYKLREGTTLRVTEHGPERMDVEP